MVATSSTRSLSGLPTEILKSIIDYTLDDNVQVVEYCECQYASLTLENLECALSETVKNHIHQRKINKRSLMLVSRQFARLAETAELTKPEVPTSVVSVSCFWCFDEALSSLEEFSSSLEWIVIEGYWQNKLVRESGRQPGSTIDSLADRFIDEAHCHGYKLKTCAASRSSEFDYTFHFEFKVVGWVRDQGSEVTKDPESRKAEIGAEKD